jgi:hypothetical protein
MTEIDLSLDQLCHGSPGFDGFGIGFTIYRPR